MTLDTGFCESKCDDCDDEIPNGDWHVHTTDGEVRCMDCAESEIDASGSYLHSHKGEIFARHPRS